LGGAVYGEVLIPFVFYSFLILGYKLTIPYKTDEGYSTAFAKAVLIHREMNGKYLNNSKQGNKEIEGKERF
jgi:hypothetical protein